MENSKKLSFKKLSKFQSSMVKGGTVEVKMTMCGKIERKTSDLKMKACVSRPFPGH